MNNNAVIDLGSNTFHILIYNFDEEPFKKVHKQREYVFLSEEGVKKIGQKAYQRGIDTLKQFHKITRSYQVKKVSIIGTATLRRASNGSAFIQEVKKSFDWDIVLISGKKEAEYIAQGVLLSEPPKTKGSQLIMDIGGGSVEFILIKDQQIHYHESYPIGISILQKQFHKSDPIRTIEKNQIQSFLSKQLQTFISFIQNTRIDILIGASGSFEIFKSNHSSASFNPYCQWINIPEYRILSQKLQKLSLKERLQSDVIPNNRAKHIVVALILIDFILDTMDTKKMLISDFALKEGVISENKYLDMSKN